MKFMMLLFRETMPDFFGKSGNAWVGTQFIVKTKEGSTLQCFYYDGFMDDKKEDAFGTLSFVEIAQSHFCTTVYPSLFPDRDPTKGIFYTVFLDGAGCFVAVENLLTRLAFSSRINGATRHRNVHHLPTAHPISSAPPPPSVYMKAMYIPEAYYNKTPLDGHFAVAGKQMRASVASGKLDAFDAESMFNARVSDLTKGEGAKNFVIHFEPNRDRQCHTKSTTIKGIKKMSARIPVWIKNNLANRTALAREDKKAEYKRATVVTLKEILSERGERTTGNTQCTHCHSQLTLTHTI